MKAYRYTTKISDKGTIQVALDPSLFNQEVELIVLPKSKSKIKNSKASDFVKKWAGFLKNNDIENSKRDYLTEKYK